MATWTQYRGLYVPDVTTQDGGTNLKNDLVALANGAPHAASIDPTITNDSGQGYDVGALWWNTSTKTLWVCSDASTGAAKWRSLFRRVDNALVLAPLAMVGTGSDGRALQFDDSTVSRGTSAVDLQRTRSAASQVAAGARAAILAGENNGAFSIDSIVAGGKGNYAGGGAITNISAANPTVVTSATHGLGTGQQITIINSNSTPTIDGNRTVTVTSANTFTVPVNVTSAGNSGTWTPRFAGTSACISGGQYNRALGTASHAEGNTTIATGDSSHAEGARARASGYTAHAEGMGANAYGQISHAEGFYTTAGPYSHAEGYSTSAYIKAHSEGSATTAGGWYSHAEGIATTAGGYQSHAEGSLCSAVYSSSHAEGSQTQAYGAYSHSGGRLSKTHLLAQWARASGGHSNQLGSAQTTITHLFGRTTNATATELTLDGSSSPFVLSDGQTISCLINIVGRKENDTGATNHCSFLRQACITRKSGTTQLVGSAQMVGNDINPAGWSVSITADNANQSLKIAVTGASSTNIRWMATVLASEVADAAT